MDKKFDEPLSQTLDWLEDQRLLLGAVFYRIIELNVRGDLPEEILTELERDLKVVLRRIEIIREKAFGCALNEPTSVVYEEFALFLEATANLLDKIDDCDQIPENYLD